MSDLVKRLGIGAGIGIIVALLVGWGTYEIGFMKSAAKISEAGMKKAYEVISPGVRQCDAVGEIQKALFYGTPEFGGEYASI